jgi:hypothetical protein
MIRIKRGDSLVFNIALTDSESEPLDLAVENIRSQVRERDGKLIASLTVAATETTGTYQLTAESTQGWPARSLECDIELDIEGTVISSETFAIEVLRDVT